MTTPRISYKPTATADLDKTNPDVYTFDVTNPNTGKTHEAVCDRKGALGLLANPNIRKVYTPTSDASKELVKRFVMSNGSLIDLKNPKPTIYNGKPVAIPEKRETHSKQINPYG